MKKIFTLILCLGLFQVSHAQFGKLKKAMDKATDKAESKLLGGTKLSQDEVGKGLKEALNVGVGKAADALSIEDGYLKSIYKIHLPGDAQAVVNKVKKVPGFQDADKKLITLLNRAAEDAATKAKPIFVSAIKKMTIQSAMNILMGNKNAATVYLKKNTNQDLNDAFLPVIQNSLDEVNARSYWNKIVTAYNKIPLTKKVEPKLDEYVTRKALEGMFGLVAEKELDIRENQASRTSDLLKKVFAKQDK